MKITIEIGGNDYAFEMNRWVYKKLLADEEYAKMQNEITKRLKDKKGDAKKAVEKVQEEMLDEDISALILRNMVAKKLVGLPQNLWKILPKGEKNPRRKW